MNLNLSPKERENAIIKEHGCVFIQRIEISSVTMGVLMTAEFGPVMIELKRRYSCSNLKL